MTIISGQLIDIARKEIYPARIEINNGIIKKIEKTDLATDQYILPGFVDAHVHVESSMLVPSEFARMAVVHGTVGTISDPHEIGNVLGVKGVEYMIANGNTVNFKFYFGAPSCVPATPFETAGAEINTADVEYLLRKKEIVYLAEMMNWPGVLYHDKTVYEKLAIAKKLGKPVDGHAPGLKGEQAQQYAGAGISTDHECFTAEEALDKLNSGMKIMIREGSAAKNFEALIPLLDEHYASMMFCSDDKHPDNLEEGHINLLVKRALAKGIDLFKILQAACINPVQHYGMKVGLLQKGDPADFIIIDNPEDFNIQETWIDGQLMAKQGKTKIKSIPIEVINNFDCEPKTPEDFKVTITGSKVQVMEALDGQLITNLLQFDSQLIDNPRQTNTDEDILKVAVINRYQNTAPSIGYIKNIGLQSGAIASSVGHDSHNIIAVGVDDESLCRAVNLIIAAQGGVSAVKGKKEMLLELPVAGIMSDREGYRVSKMYSTIDAFAKSLGSPLNSPFMTLSFMALLVIPKAKMSDMGFFDGEKFEFLEVFTN
ncbi:MULTISPECIES: adenine deaminase [Reichenbachiella]|uniref:Adenine deaminase n=1 Tax=Reichenbachiella agariperforans TaxID=156994 RepID=A0A1M6N1W3_REIAG|nr:MULTISPECIES: adenine deaminase [Reichenbachiella]MBU2915686.1 adenine deaminase [Reichenbachiella agariperforans]RJE72044.1 adenine deaminase [Reichenbachiella sp. MSK19-1]SHJ89687.1 Adenine deaminase [Reichenbachiella agariperforans]